MNMVHIVVKLAKWPYCTQHELWCKDYQILSIHSTKKRAQAEQQRLISAGKPKEQIKVISKHIKVAA